MGWIKVKGENFCKADLALGTVTQVVLSVPWAMPVIPWTTFWQLMPRIIGQAIPKMTACLGKPAQEQVTFHLPVQIQPLLGRLKVPAATGQVPTSLTHWGRLACSGFGMYLTREVWGMSCCPACRKSLFRSGWSDQLGSEEDSLGSIGSLPQMDRKVHFQGC